MLNTRIRLIDLRSLFMYYLRCLFLAFGHTALQFNILPHLLRAVYNILCNSSETAGEKHNMYNYANSSGNVPELLIIVPFLQQFFSELSAAFGGEICGGDIKYCLAALHAFLVHSVYSPCAANKHACGKLGVGIKL